MEERGREEYGTTGQAEQSTTEKSRGGYLDGLVGLKKSESSRVWGTTSGTSRRAWNSGEVGGAPRSRVNREQTPAGVLGC